MDVLHDGRPPLDLVGEDQHAEPTEVADHRPEALEVHGPTLPPAGRYFEADSADPTAA